MKQLLTKFSLYRYVTKMCTLIKFGKEVGEEDLLLYMLLCLFNINSLSTVVCPTSARQLRTKQRYLSCGANDGPTLAC